MNHVEEFFARYEADPALRAKVEEALACYPGSLELRESVVENVLLPIASDLGLPFTVDELRAYETRKKLHRMSPWKRANRSKIPPPTGFWRAAGNGMTSRSARKKPFCVTLRASDMHV